LLEGINKTIHPDDEQFKFARLSSKTQNISQVEEGYLDSGYETMKIIMDYITKFNPSLLSNNKVLDYGCGHGRIMRHITGNLKPSLLVGADVWDGAIKFCSEEFDSKPFLISNENHITNLGEKFDIIISISVFSHLPPHRFHENLKSLSLSLNDEGLLFFTTHGDFHRELKNVTLENGYFYGQVGKNPNHTDGRLPGDEYSFMCVTKDFVEKQLEDVGLKLLEFKETGITSQDLYMAKKEL